MFENPRRDRQARNFTTDAPKIPDLKSSSEQIFSRKLPLGAPDFAFNSISFLLNISFVLFDMSTWNVCRWDCMLSKAIFIHSHIDLAYKSPFIIRDLRSRTITAASQAKDAVRVRSATQEGLNGVVAFTVIG